jgi:AraC-like DNA-binding protein
LFTPKASSQIVRISSTPKPACRDAACRAGKSTTTRGRVERLLVPILHKGDVGMEKIAAKLALSPRTLLRRLTDEGVTFEKVLDELRHAMALDYLRERKTSVNETAYLLGFSDPSAFSRAFKRWTGTNPRTVKLQPRE